MDQKKDFITWMSIVPDPRIPGMVTYPLPELLLVALVGSLCRLEDWDEIAWFAKEQLAWFRKFMPFNNGIASPKTFRTVFRMIDHEAFCDAFITWASQWNLGDIVAIDGKTLRGSKDGEKQKAQHVLNAFAHDSGMCIGQKPVDGKSNEITAIPDFLNQLALKGVIITIDAMGTQKDTAAKIIDKKADYVLALKGNQGTLHDDVKLFFEDEELSKTCLSHKTLDGDHGRIEQRFCRVSDDIGWLIKRHPEWKGLRTIVAVTLITTNKKTGEVSQATRYYISSLTANAKRLLTITRAHWSVENNLHWVLDVTFHEDACRSRKDHAAINLALIRKTALNLLRQDKSCNLPLKRKRLKAEIDPDYREALISCL
jgi:predicted transposase YbfD/YdcC